MPQSLADFDAALKDDYGPGLRNAINNSNVVFTEAFKNTEDIVGRQAVWSVHTGRSTSTGSRAELAALPVADRQRFTQVRDDLAYDYHTIKVSGQAKHLTQNDSGSFARALETEIDGAEKDLKANNSRAVYNDFTTIGSTSYTGAMGKITAVSGAVITLGGSTRPEMRYFWANQKIDVINGADGTVRGTATVSSVDKSAKTVTLAAAVTGMAANDYVARQGSFGAEINGLRGLVSATKKYAGVDPAVVQEWASIEVGSSTTAISETVLDELAEDVETDGNGDMPDLYISDHLQRRKLASMLTAQKRYEGREVTLKAGWKGLQLTYGQLVADRFNPTTKVWALTRKQLVRFIGLDYTWDEDDGKVLYKALDDSDAIQARFKGYHNLEAPTRNSHGVLTLAEPVF